MVADSFEVKVHRYDPVEENHYLDTYNLEYYPSMTVLDVLEEIQKRYDSNLAFRSSCRSGKCGSCAVSLDGKPVLACRTTLDGRDIELGPLDNFPVVKDLVVDKSQFDRGQQRALAYTSRNDEKEAPEANIPEEDVDFSNISRCIGCMICESVCPIAGAMKRSNIGEENEIPDPSWLTNVACSGIRVGSSRAYLPLEDSLQYCRLCGSSKRFWPESRPDPSPCGLTYCRLLATCERACPSGVHLSELIGKAKEAYRKEQE